MFDYLDSIVLDNIENGADVAAQMQQDVQRYRLNREKSPRPDIDAMLAELREREKANGSDTPKQ